MLILLSGIEHNSINNPSHNQEGFIHNSNSADGDIVSLAHNVSLWAQKLTFYVSFWDFSFACRKLLNQPISVQMNFS